MQRRDSSRRLLVLAFFTTALWAADPTVLRVCAEPDNLPFSNSRGQGLENKLAELLAHDLGAHVAYTWWTQRRGFVRNTLGEGLCDVLMEMPARSEFVSTTQPYYRSTYVWVTRKDLGEPVSGFDDPRLKQWRIGIHRTGGDVAPPGVALGRRGLAANLRQYSLYGEYGTENAPSRLIQAVANREVDAAIVWGPLAGYFAGKDLRVTPIAPAQWDGVPFTFAMSIGVRKGDDELRRRLDGALHRHCAEVRSILLEYRVPMVGREEGVCGDSQSSPVLSR